MLKMFIPQCEIVCWRSHIDYIYKYMHTYTYKWGTTLTLQTRQFFLFWSQSGLVAFFDIFCQKNCLLLPHGKLFQSLLCWHHKKDFVS